MKIKIYTLLTFALFSATNLFAQVSIGTTTPNPSAALDVTSTTSGFLPPRMTRAQRDAIVNPIAGLQIWCLDCGLYGELQIKIGNNWTNVVGAPVSETLSVVSSTGKIWMDRNLGASRRAQSENDHLAYGSLFQWGRNADGHELINWTSATSGTPVNGTTTTLSTTDSPENNLFILNSNSPQDWRATQNNNLWQGVGGKNNPCPLGYRIPTSAEFIAEINAYNLSSISAAFNSPMKFTSAGFRANNSGTLSTIGYSGYYWSSTVSGSESKVYNNQGAANTNLYRTFGFSVRCIKN